MQRERKLIIKNTARESERDGGTEAELHTHHLFLSRRACCPDTCLQLEHERGIERQREREKGMKVREKQRRQERGNVVS